MKELLGHRRARLILMGVMLLGLLLCGACVLLAYVVPPASPGSSGRVEATVCVGAVVQPRFQVGVWWQLLTMSRAWPAMFSPYAGCMNVPMPAFMSPVGEIAFPP